jgi:hypothetical protein
MGNVRKKHVLRNRQYNADLPKDVDCSSKQREVDADYDSDYRDNGQIVRHCDCGEGDGGGD